VPKRRTANFGSRHYYALARKFAQYSDDARSRATRAHYDFVSNYAKGIARSLNSGRTIRAAEPKVFEDYFTSYEKLIAREQWNGHHWLIEVWESGDKILAGLWRQVCLEAVRIRPSARGAEFHFGTFVRGKPGGRRTVWDELRKRLSKSYREEKDKLYGGFGDTPDA
jgi:hypothetical protein